MTPINWPRAGGIAAALIICIATWLAIAAAIASAHAAVAEANCASATFHLTGFPRALSLIAVDAEIDGRPGPALMGTWEGPSADLVLNLDLAGDHVVDLYASWSAPDQRRARHQVGSAQVSCFAPPPATTPTPTPAPTPAPQPETPPVDSVSGVVPVSPPPPPTTTPPPAIEPHPRVRTRPPGRAELCPQGARWRARPSGLRAVRVRGWWYRAGCQPVLGNPRPSVPVTG